MEKEYPEVTVSYDLLMRCDAISAMANFMMF
jgi:hypothetical protein